MVNNTFLKNANDSKYLGKLIAETTNNTSGTSNFLPFASTRDSEGYSYLGINDGLIYAHKEGTTSQSGYGMLIVGNSLASGTNKNKAGMIRVTDDGSVYWWNIKGNPSSPLNGYKDVYLPPNTGTLETKPVILYNNATGTTGTVTLAYSINNYTRIKIYWRWSSNADGRFEGCSEIHRIATGSILTTLQWTNVNLLSTTSSTFDHYSCVLLLSGATIAPYTASSYGVRSGYYRIYPTTTSAPSNVLFLLSQYFYITRVEGYL